MPRQDGDCRGRKFFSGSGQGLLVVEAERGNELDGGGRRAGGLGNLGKGGNNEILNGWVSTSVICRSERWITSESVGVISGIVSKTTLLPPLPPSLSPLSITTSSLTPIRHESMPGVLQTVILRRGKGG